MIDEKALKSEYDSIKNQDKDIRLLPFEKIIRLEKAKIAINIKYLSKIKKIDNDLNIVCDEGFTIDDIKNFAVKYFGTMNFFDKKTDNNEKIIYFAFNFCILSINCKNDLIRCKVNVFWDY